jgi:hypothetical protein
MERRYSMDNMLLSAIVLAILSLICNIAVLYYTADQEAKLKDLEKQIEQFQRLVSADLRKSIYDEWMSGIVAQSKQIPFSEWYKKRQTEPSKGLEPLEGEDGKEASHG